MAMFSKWTIRSKLIVIIIATSSVALLLASFAFVAYDRIAFVRTTTRDVGILANILGMNSSAALVFGDSRGARETLLALRSEPHVETAILYDKSGTVFATYITPNVTTPLPDTAPVQFGHQFVDGSLRIVQPVLLDGDLVGTIAIQSDMEEMKSRLRRYAGIVALILMGALLIAYVIALWLQKIISGPVNHLASVAETVSVDRDYSVRANKQSEDELGFLVEQFNGMLSQIHERDLALRKAHDELAERAEQLQRELVERKRAEQERHRLQGQIQHAQRLESLGVLAGGIAHDFNNLLTGMMGHAGLALEHLDEESTAAGNVRQVELAAQRAAELTAQMLAYSGRGQFVVEVADLSAIMREMAHLLSTVISKKAILEYQLEDGIPPVEADVSQLRQVVMNLITNASDALGEDEGTIFLKTGVIEASDSIVSDIAIQDELEPGRYSYIEVADTGCGMDTELQRKIFDPFFSTKFAGRGLGLAAVMGIVRGHKGAIKVESHLEKGTRFRVLLPVASRPIEPSVSIDSPLPPTSSGTGTILVVDDEDYVRLLAQTILEKRGYEVLAAEDGRQGVEIFRERASDINVVLLDLTMPVMNGREAFAEMRRIRPDARIIVSSGYTESDAIQHFAGSAPSAFIQKPYQPNALSQRIAEVIES
jgi:signal transduction histidine kinase/CheY-like chemotaxis protein